MERSGIPINAGDFGIKRIGQRVRCMMDLGYDTSCGAVTHIGPQANKEYTVSAFLDCKLTIPPAPGIEVKEVETPICACCGDRLSWPIFAFRPIVENEQATDISALVEAAAKVTLPQREDAKAFAQGGVVAFRSPLVGGRPSEAVITGTQVAVMNNAINQTADEVTREFVRRFIIPKLVKMLGLKP